MFKTLEQLYLDKAEEAQKAGDLFAAAYWRKQSFLVHCE